MTPRVYLLSRPQLDRAYQDFLDGFLPAEEASWSKTQSMTPAEHIVEFAGRVCYMSFGSKQSGKTNAEYIANLIRHGHESVLEHAVWTIAITGVSRGFTHQLVRHRVGFSFSQLSQQYHDESEARFVRPTGIDKVPEAAAAWDEVIRQSKSAYKKIITGLGTPSQSSPEARREAVRAIRSAARSVLPNATETAVVVTANARALRHFFKIRGDILGDEEMRCVAAALLELLRPEGPALFADFTVQQMADGMPLVSHHPIL